MTDAERVRYQGVVDSINNRCHGWEAGERADELSLALIPEWAGASDDYRRVIEQHGPPGFISQVCNK